MDEESTEKICRGLRKGGCRSVHIGGGEPFLDFEGLLMVIGKLRQAGITLEYIETNAFWAAGDSKREETKEKLKRLSANGPNTLCISVDPYHAEYVPYGAPLALAECCDKTGVDYFLWKQEFIPVLSRLDSGKAHSRPDMEKNLSGGYVYDTARLYGIGYGGRAINIEREFCALYPAEKFTAEKSPCRNLLSSGHFHVDMYANFIPPRCTGIRIPLSEAEDGIPAGKYPAFEALYNGGVRALFELALQNGFLPAREPSTSPQGEVSRVGYPSGCNLCFHLRSFLAEKGFEELDRNHYVEAMKYY